MWKWIEARGLVLEAKRNNTRESQAEGSCAMHSCHDQAFVTPIEDKRNRTERIGDSAYGLPCDGAFCHGA